jgi:hypothetical protein
MPRFAPQHSPAHCARERFAPPSECVDIARAQWVPMMAPGANAYPNG